MVTYTEKSFKSIMNQLKSADSWFWTRYSINPYNGCQIGCIYCDSRSARYHLPEDFENQIVIKKNPGEMLDLRISRARKLRKDVVGLGGTTDAYQPAERKFRNSRAILQALEKHAWPVHIITKSPLVLDDAALIQRIATQSWAAVSFTITTSSESVARFLEPRASSPFRRFDAIRKLREKAPDVKIGVLFIPFVPFLTDSPENMESMVRNAAEAGVDYVLFGGGMTLRDQQAKWFLAKLEKEFPALIPKYEELYQFQYHPNFYSGNYGPNPAYSVGVHQILFDLCEMYGLATRIPRWIPEDFRKVNYLVAEQLYNAHWELQSRGIPERDLARAGFKIQELDFSVGEVQDLREELGWDGDAVELVARWVERFGG